MPEIGRLLIAAGLLLVVLGLLVSALGSALPLGRLPGDLRFNVGGAQIFIPLATGLLLSLLLTLIANVLLRLFGR